MSVKVMAAVWDRSRSELADRLVLLAIADSADHDGTNAWPSVHYLHRKTRLSERQVQRSIARLVGLGELKVERNAGGGWKVRPDRRPNAYTVLLSRGDSHDTPPPINGVTSARHRRSARGDRSDTQSVLETSPPGGPLLRAAAGAEPEPHPVADPSTMQEGLRSARSRLPRRTT